VEGSFLYSPGNTELIRAPIDTDVNVDSYYYSGNVMYNILPSKKFVPFATGGIGGVSLDVSGGNTENYLTYNFGGGVLYRLSRRIMVRFDARDYVYTVDSLGDGSVAALNLPANFDETIHDLSLSGGVTFILP
jgi:opacity protein-like surface antigen